MAEVIALSGKRSTAPKRASVGGAEAAILLFTGIRYERCEAELDAKDAEGARVSKPLGKTPPKDS